MATDAMAVEVEEGVESFRRSRPFSLAEARQQLPFDISNSIYLEVQHSDMPLYSYVWRFVSKLVKDARSIRADINRGGRAIYDEMMEELMTPRGFKGVGKGGMRSKRKREEKTPSPGIGLGWHKFTFEYDECSVPVVALMQSIGRPVGNPPSVFSSIILFVEGSDQTPLLKLCEKAKGAATETKENRVSLWRFEKRYHSWETVSCRLSRSIDSVVLDPTIKKPLLDDLQWFVRDETRAFYAKHGIPYHRCYLFHGEPGTGKTSFIYALAGYLERNLCFIQMDRSMTDDTFRTAMSHLPPLSIAVLEDVDALFTNHRESDQNSASLSFSGFLNTLDGLGAPDDVLVFMTTNHPEKLDPAVTRPGRIDMKVAFKPPSQQMAVQYFLTFYPEAEAAAASFGEKVADRLTEKRISMAQLQHFFLACHRLEFDAERAAEHIVKFAFNDIATSSGKWSSAYM